MKKNYVLDTNVLLHDPRAIFRFEDNDVIIPIYVIEEVDQFKREGTERGRNARTIARLLDDLRERAGRSSRASRSRRVVRSRGCAREAPRAPIAIDHAAMDAAILQTAFDVLEQDGAKPTIFVTMDTNLRIRADALGMVAETYENMRVEAERLDTGSRSSTSTGARSTSSSRKAASRSRATTSTPNICVLLRERARPLAHRARPLGHAQREVVALRDAPRRHHRCAPAQQGAELRHRPLARRVGAHRDVGRQGRHGQDAPRHRGGPEEDHRGRHVHAHARVAARDAARRDIGYLPGDVDEKLNPWMQPIFDNLEFLFSTGSRRGPRAYAELLESGQIQVEPLTYIRGRSLPQQFIIVDEAQNLTPHEVKTIITRSGDGTKIVLTGDPQQIDNPYVDSASNGLTIAADKFRGEKLAGHIVLAKGERSDPAELAANLL